MNKSVIAGAVASAAVAFALTAASSVQAAEQFNQDLASPGVYFGSGNAARPQEFTINTADGVEIGLRSKITNSQDGQIVPIGNTYFIPIGDLFNFDYSFNPDIDGSEVTGLTALITVSDQMTGGVKTFDPSKLDNTLGNSFGAPGGYQNSEKISFHFLFPGYNANLNDTFHVTYTVNGLSSGPLSVDNIVQVGSGAPEPASWALMILGFAGIGAGLRRSRKTSVLTAA